MTAAAICACVFGGAAAGFVVLGNWPDAWWSALVTVLLVRIHFDQTEPTS